jgi:hypothetical protein
VPGSCRPMCWGGSSSPGTVSGSCQPRHGGKRVVSCLGWAKTPCFRAGRRPAGQMPIYIGGSLMNGWMWRPAEVEAIYRGARRSKGVANRHEKGMGRSAWAIRSGPVSAGFGPSSLPDASWSIVDLLPYACGTLTSSSPWFR